MEEIWKDIKGYEGCYQVSSSGRIKSIERIVRGPSGNKKIKSRILKEFKNQFGYYMVSLFKNGKHKNFQVHRLVAHSFILNPLNLPQVNHIDGNKENNCVDNLEWITNRDNVIHAYKNNLRETIKIDKETLINLYVNEKYPVYKLAEIFGYSKGTIKKNLLDYGVEIRGNQGSKKKFNITKEFLKKELETKSVLEISKQLGGS